MENKRKHLEFIENAITRMNTNSFMIKGWTITLVSALFALAAKDANRLYVFIAYIPLPLFWILDGFFLSKERQYRGLYNKVSVLEENKIDFSMNTKEFYKDKNTWICSIFSKTLVTFYIILLLLTLVIMFAI